LALLITLSVFSYNSSFSESLKYSIAACYWNKLEKTNGTVLGAWINTDDNFFQDEEGFFFYIDRSNDMLKNGGIWVFPIEVEALPKTAAGKIKR